MKLYAKKSRKVLACILAIALLIPCVAALPVFATETGAFYVAAGQGTEGYYTSLANAIDAVNDGGTIKMTQDYGTAENLDGKTKGFTLDGGGYTWDNATNQSSVNYVVRLGTNQKKVVLKNITLDYAATTNANTEVPRVLQISDRTEFHLVLSENVTFANTGAAVGIGIMRQQGGTVTVDGANFTINASAMATWGEGTHNIVLNSGTLSSGGTYALYDGYIANKATQVATITGTGNVQVYDGTQTRALRLSDINMINTTVNLTGVSEDFAADATTYIAIKETKIYATGLANAVNAAADGAILTVHGTLSSTSALTLTKNLTLKGADANAKLVGGDNNILTLGNASLNMEDLTLQNAGSSAANATIVLGTAEGQTNTLTLNSGARVVNTVVSDWNSAGNGINVAFAGTHSIVINDGAEITTGGTALRLETYAVNVTMNGGKITARYRGVDLASDNSVFTMNGGTIEVTTDKGSGGQGLDGGWCICSYQKTPTVTLNGGTLIAVKGSNTSIIGAAGDASKLTVRQGVTMKYKDGTSEEQVLSDSTATFSNNYMYLYLPDVLTGAEDAAMAFATQVDVAEGLTVKEYGMVILPNAILKDGELTTETDRVLKITDSALTANGYIECGVSNVAAGLAQLNSAMSGRAYVIVTVNLGGVIADVTLYGDVMSACGAEFANAYKYYNADWASNATVKSVVDTFAGLTVTD